LASTDEKQDILRTKIKKVLALMLLTQKNIIRIPTTTNTIKDDFSHEPPGIGVAET